MKIFNTAKKQHGIKKYLLLKYITFLYVLKSKYLYKVYIMRTYSIYIHEFEDVSYHNLKNQRFTEKKKKKNYLEGKSKHLN